RGKTHAPLRPCSGPGGCCAARGSGFHEDALDGGRMMGLTTAEMLTVIASLSRRQFYKSMTSFADHRIWQDVYHAATPVRKDAYIKITLRDAAPVIQFKEK